MQQFDLSELKDVHEPEGIKDFFTFANLWPPAAGWWILLAIIILIPIIFYSVKQIRIRSAKLYALRQMEKLQDFSGTNAAKFAEETSKLLKRIAILRFGKDKVASLSGKEWVSFLIKTGDLQLSDNLISLFAYSPYAKIEKSDKSSILSLNEAAEIWIRKNT